MVQQLSLGAVRLRCAIDVHLGRWTRAASWLCLLLAASAAPAAGTRARSECHWRLK